MEMKEILEAAKKSMRLEWHSYTAFPSVRRFGTWNIPRKDFDGADDMAFQRHFPLEVTFFYRENKTSEDFEVEKRFEEDVRAVGKFSAVSDYIPSDKLFFTQYTFNLTEEMEET